jgi:hypothetical protein
MSAIGPKRTSLVAPHMSAFERTLGPLRGMGEDRHRRNDMGPWFIMPTPLLNLQFEHPEDRRFFIDLLTGGDEQKFEAEFLNCFDFREPAIKPKEFNALRKKAFRDLLQKHGETCQLRIHADCSKDKKWEVDHIIPLATNELNKKLRNITRSLAAKVPSQSLGSNHPTNLILVCRRCNAFKKHRMIKPQARRTG